jgi:hypothetical protein
MFWSANGSHLAATRTMADNGVIFSDGIEADYLTFTAGFTATIGIAARRASLVVPNQP